MSENRPFALARILAAVLLFWLTPGAPSWGQSPPQTQSVTLAWDPSPDPTVAGYCFYFGALGGGAPIRVDVGNQTQFTATNLQTRVTYLFYVTAYDAARTESDPSNQITYTPGGPNPPDQLQATVTGQYQITLAWNDNSTNEDGFIIERSLDGSDFATLATTGPNVTNYLVSDPAGFPAGMYPYSFRVSAFQGFTSSPYSAVATAITNQADLEVIAVRVVPTVPVAGAPVLFSATVVNLGAAANPQGVLFRLAFQVDGGVPVAWADASSSLPPGGTLTLSASDGPGGQFTWPALAGLHTLSAAVGSPGQTAGTSQPLSLPLVVVPATPTLVLTGVPADMTTECGAVPPPSPVTARDGCDPAPRVTLTETRVPGNCPQSYRLVRTWTATDVCGSQNSATQILTVRDTTPPVLVGVPVNATAEFGAVPPPPPVTATDNGDPAPMVTMTETTTAGACPLSYQLARTWTATDACGNHSSATQILTVQDTTPPGLVGVPADATVECNAVPTPPVVTTLNHLDPNAAVTMTETRTAGACPQSYQLVRTWTATDACGNQSSASQTLTVRDTTPPVLAGVPPDVTVDPTAVPPPPLVTATDNGDPAPVVTLAETNLPGSSPLNYQLVRTWTATDACGNQTNASQTITVQPAAFPAWQLVALSGTLLHFTFDTLAGQDTNSGTTGPFLLAALTNRTAAGGWVAVAPSGALWYAPPPDNAFTGADSVIYAASNSLGLTVCSTWTVQVVASPTAPALALDPPPPHTLVTLRSEVPLSATVNDPAHLIERVEFYAGLDLVAVATNRVNDTYGAVWSGARTACWTLSATAYTSDRRIIGSPPAKLWLMSLPMPAETGRLVIIEVSPDLVNWSVVKAFILGSATQVGAPGTFNVEDNSSEVVRFYRARAL